MSDAGECDRCNARLHTLAAFCSRCGQIVPRKAQLQVPEELRRVADRQRLLLRVTLAYFIAQAILGAVLDSNLPMLIVVVGATCFLLLILLMVCVLSLANALRLGPGVSVLLTTFCLLPIVNLIIASWLSSRAAKELRVAGIRTGVLGAKKRDVDMVEYVHRCRSCGYDLRGLTSLKCPECGIGFAAPLVSASG